MTATYLSNTSVIRETDRQFYTGLDQNITTPRELKPTMSTQITPPQGNGGSRESSEFEFVNVLNRSNPPVQHSNPLLLSSNQAAPGPGILLSTNQPALGLPALPATPANVRPPPPPAVSIEQPTPTLPVLASPSPPGSLPVSVPAVPDQTRVATVTAESPPTPGERPGETAGSSCSVFCLQECSAG